MPNWSSNELLEVHKDLIIELGLHQGLSVAATANYLTNETGRKATFAVVRRAFEKVDMHKRRNNKIQVEDVTEEGEKEIPIKDLIKSRIEAYNRKEQRYKKHYRTIKLPAEPIGLFVAGDPHVDNEGCSWGELMKHVELIQDTCKKSGPCILCISVGDQHDNWPGRMGQLYANASMLASDGWRLSEWLFTSLQWLAVVGGNHDRFANPSGVDLMAWLTKKCKVLAYAPDEIQLSLEFKDRSDLEPIILTCRHFFRGTSWFHPTHGSNKQSMLSDGHIYVSGHIHQYGYLTTENQGNRIVHNISVRGYKRFDSYAKRLGFYEQKNGMGCLITIDPFADEPGRIKVWFDIEDGCNYLMYLREKREAEHG